MGKYVTLSLPTLSLSPSLTPHLTLTPHPHPSPLTPHPHSPLTLTPHPHPSLLTPHPSLLTPHSSHLTPHSSPLPHPTEINLDGRRSELKEHAHAVSQQSKLRDSRRMQLRTLLKRYTEKDETITFGKMMKSFQKEVLTLTAELEVTEKYYLDFHSLFISAPDPVNAFESSWSKEQQIELLLQKCDLQLDTLRDKDRELEEVESELKKLKNQDLTVRRLEQENKRLEDDMEKRLQRARVDVETAFLTRQHGIKEKHAEQERALRHQLAAARNSLEEARVAHDETKSQVFELTAKLEQIEAASDTANNTLVDELERMNAALRLARQEKSELERRLTSSEDYKQENMRTNELESEVQRLQDLLSRAAADEQQISIAADRKVALFQEQLKQKQNDVQELENRIQQLEHELDGRPTRQQYMQLCKTLKVLRAMKFGGEDEDEDEDDAAAIAAITPHNNKNNSSGSSHAQGPSWLQFSDSEHLLLKKIKSLESSSTQLRVELREKANALELHMNSVRRLETELKQQTELVARLERDLSAAQFQPSSGVPSASPSPAPYYNGNGNGNGSGSGGSGSSAGDGDGDGSTRINILSNVMGTDLDADIDSNATVSDHSMIGAGAGVGANTASQLDSAASMLDKENKSMFDAVCAQRDRFRKRIQELEQHLKDARDDVNMHKRKYEDMRTDNVKLYERLQYVRNYNHTNGSAAATGTGTGTGTGTATDMDSTGKYGKKRYGTSSRSRIDPYGHLNSSSNRDSGRPASAVSMTGNSDRDPERKYAGMYEDRVVNPFREFKQKQKQQQYAKLSCGEKVLYNVSRVVFRKGFYQTFAFVYAIALHLLVFFTLWEHTVSPHEHHLT
jgi:homeobox protein cut-like